MDGTETAVTAGCLHLTPHVPFFSSFFKPNPMVGNWDRSPRSPRRFLPCGELIVSHAEFECFSGIGLSVFAVLAALHLYGIPFRDFCHYIASYLVGWIWCWGHSDTYRV